MKWCAAFFLAVVAAGTIAPTALAQDASVRVPSERRTYNLNPGWRTAIGEQAGAEKPEFEDRAWRQVSLPNAFNETEAFARDIKQLSTGIIWYRKHLSFPGPLKGKALIEFEGVRQAADVWVNGRHVALHENGAMAFAADISSALVAGDNVIAVRVDNDWKYRERATRSGFQWNNDNFNVNYGGITKNVRLHLTGPVYQTLALYSGLATTGQYIIGDSLDVR